MSAAGADSRLIAPFGPRRSQRPSSLRLCEPLSRIFSRPDFLAGVRDMTPSLLGLFPFGLVCGVTLLASLVADLVFLPATILVYRRYISKGGGSGAPIEVPGGGT